MPPWGTIDGALTLDGGDAEERHHRDVTHKVVLEVVDRKATKHNLVSSLDN